MLSLLVSIIAIVQWIIIFMMIYCLVRGYKERNFKPCLSLLTVYIVLNLIRILLD